MFFFIELSCIFHRICIKVHKKRAKRVSVDADETCLLSLTREWCEFRWSFVSIIICQYRAIQNKISMLKYKIIFTHIKTHCAGQLMFFLDYLSLIENSLAQWKFHSLWILKKIVWDISFTVFFLLPSEVSQKYCCHTGNASLIATVWIASFCSRSHQSCSLSVCLAVCELPNSGIDALLEDLNWFLTS